VILPEPSVNAQDCIVSRQDYPVVFQRLKQAGYNWGFHAQDSGYDPFDGHNALYLFTDSRPDRSHVLLHGSDSEENDGCKRLDLNPYRTSSPKARSIWISN